MNAEIEHASPYGKAEGEKVPGEKKKIGPAAMRAWVENGRPDPDAVRSPVPAAMPPALPPARRFSDVVIAGAVLGVQIFWAGRTLTRFIRKRV